MRATIGVGVGVVVAVLLLDASAQERDYSKGFASFHQLGLPKATAARYVQLRVNRPDYYGHSGLNLKGNAWLLREDETKGVFIYRNCTQLEVWRESVIRQEWQQQGAGEDPLQMHLLSMAERRDHGSWEPADVDADIKALGQHLDKAAEILGNTGAAGRLDMTIDEMLGDHSTPTVFLFCAHLAESGKRQEANALLGRLFHLGTPAEIIAAGLQILADARYEEALIKLTDSGDWGAFRAAVIGVRDDFGDKWPLAQAATLLLHRVEERLQAGVPEVQGTGLSEEHRRLARDLADTPARYLQMPGGLWILPAAHGPLGAAGVTARLQALGVAALPMLIALIADETLVPARMPHHRGPLLSHDSLGLSAEESYEFLPRPASRGEMARSLLLPLLPGAEEEEEGPLLTEPGRAGDAGHDELRRRAERLYAQLEGKSEADILRFYLTDTSGNARLQALTALLEMPDLDPYAADIERVLETWESQGENDYSAQQVPHYVAQYLARRGPASREFGAQYLARCRQRLAALKAPRDAGATDTDATAQPMFVRGLGDWQIQQLESAIRELQDALSDASLADVLREVLDGSRDVQGLYSALGRYASQPRNEVIPVVLKAALAADDPEKAVGILQVAMSLGMASQRPRSEPAPREPYAAAADKGAWEALLADRRETSQQLMTLSVATMAATILEMLCGGEEAMQQGYEQMQALPTERLERAWVARAQARLAGKTGAELPEIVPVVDRGKAAAAATRLAELAPDKLPEFIDALATDEYISLIDLARTDTALRDRFAPLARKIGRAEGNLEGLGLAPGGELTVDVLKAVVEQLKKEAAQGKTRYIALQRQNPASGFVVRESSDGKTPFGRWGAGMDHGSALAMVQAMVMAGDQHGMGAWPVTLPQSAAAKAPAAADELDEIVDDNLDSLLTASATDDGLWPVLEAILKDPAADPFRPVTMALIVTQPGVKGADDGDAGVGP